MMREHLGEAEAGTAILKAVATVTAAGQCLPPDIGGTASTATMDTAIAEALASRGWRASTGWEKMR